jgi:hypothetical protein
MPVNEETVLDISCDNPDCPGHPDLDSSDRTGWLFVTHEVYGQPTAAHVFGDYDCLAAASTAAAIAPPPIEEIGPPIEIGPGEPDTEA